MKKRCLSCGIEKSIDDFHKAKLGVLGRQTKCKKCTSEWHRAYNARSDVKEKKGPRVRVYNKKWREANPEKAKENYAIWRAKTPAQALGKSLRRSLQRHPTDCPVTLKELMQIWDAQDGCCVLSGIKMTWGMGTYYPTSISIDRINSDIGYTKENVRLICYAINAMKGVWDDKHVIEMSLAIAAKNSAKTADPTWQSFPAFTNESDFMVLH